MKLMKNNKQVGGLQSFMLGIVSVGVILAVGLIVLTELKSATDSVAYMCTNTSNFGAYNASSDLCYNVSDASKTAAPAHSAAYNSSGSIITKLATVPTWVGIIIVVALAFVVLGYFYATKQ